MALKREKIFIKILSFFLAFFLWVYVMSSDPLTIEKKMVVDFNLSPDLAVSNEITREVIVKVKGPRVFLRELQKEERVAIDISQRVTNLDGKNEIFFRPADLQLPWGVDLIEVNPSHVSIEVEKKVTKRVPLVKKIIGAINEQHRLVKLELKTEEVTIRGPSGLLRLIDKVETLPIDLTKLVGRGEIQVPIEVDQRISVDGEKIANLSYEIKPREANLILKEIPIRFLSSNQKFKSSDRTASLSVLVAEGSRKAIRPNDVEVMANLSERGKGRQKVKLEARTSKDIHLLQIHPEYITVDFID